MGSPTNLPEEHDPPGRKGVPRRSHVNITCRKAGRHRIGSRAAHSDFANCGRRTLQHTNTRLLLCFSLKLYLHFADDYRYHTEQHDEKHSIPKARKQEAGNYLCMRPVSWFQARCCRASNAFWRLTASSPSVRLCCWIDNKPLLFVNHQELALMAVLLQYMKQGQRLNTGPPRS